jgi:hypothetical protein
MRRSRGKEPYVLRMDSAQELFGVHAELIESALCPDERVLYLLYSPMFPAEKTPFGIHVRPASHGVAVTEDRFVISEDRHIEGNAPTVRSIPFDTILSVELGNAILLGWFAIRCAEDKNVSCCALSFTNTGKHHFERAIRAYRATTGRAYRRSPNTGMDWTDVWMHTPRTQVEAVKSLVIEGENPVGAIRSSELWGSQKRRWKRIPVCFTADGIVISTNVGVIYSVDEPLARPDIYSFGVNVSCIPFEAIRSVRIFEEKSLGIRIPSLRLHLRRAGVTAEVDIPFDGHDSQAACSLACGLSLPLEHGSGC